MDCAGDVACSGYFVRFLARAPPHPGAVPFG